VPKLPLFHPFMQNVMPKVNLSASLSGTHKSGRMIHTRIYREISLHAPKSRLVKGQLIRKFMTSTRRAQKSAWRNRIQHEIRRSRHAATNTILAKVWFALSLATTRRFESTHIHPPSREYAPMIAAPIATPVAAPIAASMVAAAVLALQWILL
jgi:hypothetical protein